MALQPWDGQHNAAPLGVPRNGLSHDFPLECSHMIELGAQLRTISARQLVLENEPDAVAVRD